MSFFNQIKKHKMIFVIVLLAIVAVAFFLYKRTLAGQVTSEQYNKQIVADSWSKKVEDDGVAQDLTPSGLAYNGTFITGKQSNKMFPFIWKPFFEKRSGKSVIDKAAPFEGKYMYCVASHTQNYSLEFGTQAYFDKIFRVGGQSGLPDFTPDEFNFIMLSEACYYPGSKELSRVYDHPAGTPAYLVSQCIAWMATDGAFSKDEPFLVALNKFQKSAGYKAITEVDFTDQPVHNMLNAKPTLQAAIDAGCKNMADAYFYDIWRAADLTNKLNISLEEEKSTFNVDAKLEEDGQYHAYADLFKTPELSLFLNGITFAPSGDWQYVGQTADGLSHFVSPSGEIGEGGSIGSFYWPEGKVGFLIPKDMSSAKLATFQFYCEAAGLGAAFKNSQTYFASEMDKDLQIYITVGASGSSDIEVKRYQHEETWNANYNVNLIKYDSETGKPLADSHWDILEKFDDSQLDDTDLDITSPGNYDSNLGSLNSTSWEDGDDISTNYDGNTGLNTSAANLYNWQNDDGSQFDKWSDPLRDPCDRDDNVTGKDGYLNEINSNGSDSGKRAHTDTKRYIYSKGYCGGHPAPVVEYVEIPEPEYDELTGECTNEDAIEEAEEENQRLHDEAWAAWYAEVEKCEQLAEQGGFFHAIERGVAQKAMEEDRDQFYKDFISLNYDYSAREIKAPKGYILHGTHKDDIPIEWRTVSSSEYKATGKASNFSHTSGGSGSDPDFDTDSIISTRSLLKTSADNASEDSSDRDETDNTFKMHSISKEDLLPSLVKASKTEFISTPSTAEKVDFVFEDEVMLDDGKDEFATSSSATRTKGHITPSGLADNSADNFLLASKMAKVNAKSNKSTDVELLPSIADEISPPKSNIIDWTFITYNHRTEGEVHINKRDFDLNQHESFESYSKNNGDGTLEGAVYGLFAANNIVHPDGHTGVVYEKDDLVSVATTDRDGNASFMAITEAPGYTYDYNKGMITKTSNGWADRAPKNLYMDKSEADKKEQDNERFVGYTDSNSKLSLTDSSAGDETYYKKHSSNQGVDGTGSSGSFYPIGNNEKNNGNSWIGRPVIVEANGTQYYVKELARSEGYELSVYGKDASIMTNKDAFNAGGGSFTNGSAVVSKIDMDKRNGGNTFSINSADALNGYDIHASNIPENAKFYVTNTEYVWDDSVTHLEEREREVPVYAQEGTYVLINGTNVEANVGDVITLPNGTTVTVNKTVSPDLSKTTVKPSNLNKVTGAVLTPGPDSDDVISDVNKLLSSNGYRETDKGSPWVLVPIADESQAKICEAINAEILENEDYNVFNALRLAEIVEIDGNKYAAVSYAYKYASTVQNAIYNEDTQKIYVKKNVKYKEDGTEIDGYFYKEYELTDCETYETNSSGFVTSAVVPNETVNQDTIIYLKDIINDKVTYSLPKVKSYWVYADGEQLRKSNGDFEVKVEKYMEEVSPTQVVKTTNKELTNVTYNGNYNYNIHIDKEQIPEDGDIDFRISFTNDTAIVNGTTVSAQNYIYANGVISISFPLVSADSYIVDTFLTYPGDGQIISDAGTIKNPLLVLERPIRQRIKVTKDIQVNSDGTYENDTYGEIMDTAAVNKMENFRFKAYLKSNLERLYRDSTGNVVWVDRNGNILTPNYSDTNGDGNYDTVTWTETKQDGSGNVNIDFPEKQVYEENKALSSNVQPIYTKVEHNRNSTTKGEISNNVWASYKDPQTGSRENVGDKQGYITSHEGDKGNAVNTNGSLYSYDGNNFNVKKTDRINEEQNIGYTRILETITPEKGTKKEAYNYKKFFDAIYAANTDKWDNDMYLSNKNYPGQRWFETFYEKYQRDDTDQDYTVANTDGMDKDGTARGDRNTSFKPFDWIRKNIFKEKGEEKDYYNGVANNADIENTINTSPIAHENAEASDVVRQFAIDYYLQDEVAKLVQNNGQDEDEAITKPTYSDEVYDTALHSALIKATNYLKPFYDNDLDTIYSVEWDKEDDGGVDDDYTTLRVSETDEEKGYYYSVSSYLPYGTYVIVEQQPGRIDGKVNDFSNKSFKIDNPKEVTIPTLFEGNESNDTFDNYNTKYFYNPAKVPEELAKEYYIRFNEEWAGNRNDDLRNYVIRAHNNDGDYEVYKYGLDIDKLNSNITYNGSSYTYNGFGISQDIFDPLKDYYNPIHKVKGTNITAEAGANNNSHYYADDGNGSMRTANGGNYETNAIEERYSYASVSENSGTLDNIITMTGNQTAYEGKYASMLIPWTVVTPIDLEHYDSDKFMGFADIGFRNIFYTTKLRIEKLDSETGENILHDCAVFGLYAANRYVTQKEVDEAIASGAPETTKIGDVKYYLSDTTIKGTYEFLKAMRAENITSVKNVFGYETNQCSGIVPAGTPICEESGQIILHDDNGAKTGEMTVYTTTNDINMVNEEDSGKENNDQNTGYFVTPQPIGAGVYVLAEIKPPEGYARSKPIAIEIYSDAVTYYMNGDMQAKVNATLLKTKD
ncbi:hypothetical protein [Lacrimispora amygdalina]|uniref:hypothetical protein n=1 Tax=Lacrimispora amygdalina TaxID=253257 RepID=UPI000BE46380|nr:hypothetical protein [Lacrimispora amygdalina]